MPNTNNVIPINTPFAILCELLAGRARALIEAETIGCDCDHEQHEWCALCNDSLDD